METVDEKSSFKQSFRERRCVVPANGFYEWKETADGKIPHYIRPKNEDLLRFAGLWDLWTDPDTGSSLTSFTIVTTRANETLNEIHDRMPVMLGEKASNEWLNPDNTAAELKKLAHSSDTNDRLAIDPVSKSVNNPSHDVKDCIEPV